MVCRVFFFGESYIVLNPLRTDYGLLNDYEKTPREQHGNRNQPGGVHAPTAAAVGSAGMRDSLP